MRQPVEQRRIGIFEGSHGLGGRNAKLDVGVFLVEFFFNALEVNANLEASKGEQTRQILGDQRFLRVHLGRILRCRFAGGKVFIAHGFLPERVDVSWVPHTASL